MTWSKAALCPERNFSLPICQPDTGHWTHGMLLTGLTVEIRKAALQFTSTESHCRHWRRKILIQVCSVCSQSQNPVLRQVWAIAVSGKSVFPDKYVKMASHILAHFSID